jgi:hypothetical protein
MRQRLFSGVWQPGRFPQADGRWSSSTESSRRVRSIHKDGKASVVEPRRSSDGKAILKDGVAILLFKDDRLERWTPIGRRIVVEHWFPSARFPKGIPVRGLAQRVP